MRSIIPIVLGAFLLSSAVAQDSKTKLIFVKIPESIMPLERGTKYEDPIDAEIIKMGLGSVSGGGTQLDSDKKTILWVGVDVDVYDIDRTLPHLKRILSEINAPKGTTLECHYDQGIVELPLYDDK